MKHSPWKGRNAITNQEKAMVSSSQNQNTTSSLFSLDELIFQWDITLAQSGEKTPAESRLHLRFGML